MLYLACLFIILAALGGEYFALYRWRRSIPLRIHVHGTRGKSSTTRELARLLRQQGLKVVAKTTGDAPEYILPDASVHSIRRFGPARITEHIAIIRKAARLRADAIVVEGMALQRETLWASEKILRANIVVIVNVRPDHEETMGQGEEGVAQSLALLLPAASQRLLSGQTTFQLFLSAEKGTEYLIEQARQKNILCTAIAADPLCQASALALAVSRAVGGNAAIEKDKVSRALPPRACSPACTLIRWQNTELLFCDLFSANDVQSSRLLWEAFGTAYSAEMQNAYVVALLATRADRPLRTKAFMDWLRGKPHFDCIQVAGNHGAYAWLRGICQGFFAQSQLCPVRWHPGLPPARLLDRLCQDAEARGKHKIVIACMGNVHGYGELWRSFMQELSARPAWPE